MSTTVSTGVRSQSTMSNLQSHRPPTFGLSITPYSNNVDEIFKLAKTADALGLDIVGIQDHPYNGSFFDTWTLISTLAMLTKKIKRTSTLLSPDSAIESRLTRLLASCSRRTRLP